MLATSHRIAAAILHGYIRTDANLQHHVLTWYQVFSLSLFLSRAHVCRRYRIHTLIHTHTQTQTKLSTPHHYGSLSLFFQLSSNFLFLLLTEVSFYSTGKMERGACRGVQRGVSTWQGCTASSSSSKRSTWVLGGSLRQITLSRVRPTYFSSSGSSCEKNHAAVGTKSH